MLEAQIPKDIRRYETKLVGPFTLRQLIFFIATCGVCFVVYKFVSLFASSDLTVFITFISAIPTVAFGWIKPYGMTLEKFLSSALVSNVLAPKERLYKTDNLMKVASVKINKMSSKEYKKRLQREKKLAQKDHRYEAFK